MPHTQLTVEGDRRPAGKGRPNGASHLFGEIANYTSRAAGRASAFAVASAVVLVELIRVSAAHNSFVGIEHLTDDELHEIRSKCELRAKAETAGDAMVERTGKKARQAADQAAG